MATKKAYTPVASYEDLQRVDLALAQAQTANDIRAICATDGPKVGYKAFCYMLVNRMTAEAMKPDEACVAAAALEKAGDIDKAKEIYRKVLASHPDHVVAQEKLRGE